ncbi:MAG: hypothetical protein WCB55_01395, partial [Pseudolabrys sp.]
MIIMVVVASPLVVMVSMIIMIAVIAATPAGEAEDVILNVAEVEDVVIVEDGTGESGMFCHGAYSQCCQGSDHLRVVRRTKSREYEEDHSCEGTWRGPVRDRPAAMPPDRRFN